ncbi:MAG TPA: hydantoinase B/oxoprolinase family protein [Patescibacteria group bacterium]|nr:hydantoinase B/oxoprolinase family protein [Patescibacteria group bacterium]
MVSTSFEKLAGQKSGDWLGIPGLRQDMPIDDLVDAIALDVLRPLPFVDPQIDPVRYEVAVHRIIASLSEGSAALVRTSSSPLVTECGEYMFAIYDAEGHAAYVTAGVLPHLSGTEAGIKFIRHCYEDDIEGIHPGDQFLVNEPYLMGIHTPDILVAKPIFAGEEIVAWLASLTHTIEIGAKDPGGTSDSTDIFQEGIRVPCMKLLDRGRPIPHVYRLIERGVRHPALVSLDITAKVAGNNVAAARVEDMVAQEGGAFVRGVLSKMINESEVKTRRIIQQIPDGSWHNVVYGDHNGLQSAIFKVEVNAEKRGDVVHFDFTGTSPQNPGPVNAAMPGTIGAIFAVLVSTLFCDLHPNRGIVSCCKVTIPKGCMYNPRYPAALFAAPPGPLALLSSVVTKLVSQMAMAGGLKDSICSPWHGHVNSAYMGGVDQYGQLQGTVTLDTDAAGTGATPFMDGDDTAAYMLAPGAILSDVEMYEASYPVVYLFRRQRTDSAGYGQMRGGLGGEIGVAIHGSTQWRVGFRGLGTLLSMTHGMAGGFPADLARAGYVIGAKPFELPAAEYAKCLLPVNELAHSKGAEPSTALVAPRLLAPGDIYYLAWPGGGGYGDPLTRDPQAVLTDLRAGILSVDRGRDPYGVVVGSSGEVDVKATAALRQKMRRERLAGAEAPKQPTLRTGGDLHLLRMAYGVVHLAEVQGEKVLACADCSTVLCKDDANFHDHVPSRLTNPAAVGHVTVRTEWELYREYYCPGCGLLLDVLPELVEGAQ